jgi:hypothetical protein
MTAAILICVICCGSLLALCAWIVLQADEREAKP